MIHMSIPKHHWPKTLLTACYLINRVSSVSLNNGTPFHILFPDKPLHSLPPRTFGYAILLQGQTSYQQNQLSVCSLDTLDIKKVIFVTA